MNQYDYDSYDSPLQSLITRLTTSSGERREHQRSERQGYPEQNLEIFPLIIGLVEGKILTGNAGNHGFYHQI